MHFAQSFSACREDRGCTPRSAFSASREGKGCTPHNFSSPFHASTVSLPSRLVYDSIAEIPRAPACGYRVVATTHHGCVGSLGSVRRSRHGSARARSVVRSVHVTFHLSFFRLMASRVSGFPEQSSKRSINSRNLNRLPMVFFRQTDSRKSVMIE